MGFKDWALYLALLLIVLAFFAMVQQRRGPKMRAHRVQQPEHVTTPTKSIPNDHSQEWMAKTCQITILLPFH